MSFRTVVLALSASSTLVLTSCGGSGGSSYSYQNVTVTIAPQITSLPVNGTQTFTATVVNAPPNVSWSMWGSDPAIVGSFPAGRVLTNGTTVTYTAPSAPPVYQAMTGNGPYYQDRKLQGIVQIFAGAPNSQTAWTSAQASVNVAIIGPMSAGILPTAASVPLGKLQNFTGYCVGSTNNTIVWQVNSVAGGGVATGTIAENVSGSAFFTAPAAMPMTGNTVTVSAVCQADSTKTASATVTLQ